MSQITCVVNFIKSLKLLHGIDKTLEAVSPYVGTRKLLPNGDSVSLDLNVIA